MARRAQRFGDVVQPDGGDRRKDPVRVHQGDAHLLPPCGAAPGSVQPSYCELLFCPNGPQGCPEALILPVPGARGRIPLRYARDLRPLAAVPLAASNTSLHRPLRGTPRCAPWLREAPADTITYQRNGPPRKTGWTAFPPRPSWQARVPETGPSRRAGGRTSSR